ncbi:hypothetical protein LBMAG49_23270 [Planctomycetota bacterium]|nr:hypothetical protein LBMAG49_23270 [Planctomycetota bacterium]
MTRAVLSKLAGVSQVQAFGHNGKALVSVTDSKAFTEAIAKEALLKETKELRLRKMTKV